MATPNYYNQANVEVMEQDPEQQQSSPDDNTAMSIIEAESPILLKPSTVRARTSGSQKRRRAESHGLATTTRVNHPALKATGLPTPAGPREKHAGQDVALFLKEFPAQRKKIKKCIRHLLAMADAINKTHKKCTIASIAANSTSASSGILTILGMGLAPFTAGGSLILTVGALGLGAVATAADLSASICESFGTSKEKEKAQELINECRKILKMVKCPGKIEFSSKLPPDDFAGEGDDTDTFSKVGHAAMKIYDAGYKIKTNVKVLKGIRANPGLKVLAKRAAGSTSQVTKQVKKTFSGTTFAMAKGAKLIGAATAWAFVLYDAYNIAQDAKHLKEGAEAEMAAEIRDEVKELEAELQELEKCYKKLKNKLQ